MDDVLSDGPGAVVRMLLPCFPMEKVDTERCGLLEMMAAVVRDHECVELLLQRQVDVNTVSYYYGIRFRLLPR